ncbi:MAG: putative ABC transporter permease [Verrucomicrobiae bacterium]|nr:putative ABC transporter permease [Verrucomicrobiae bacterium]
MNLAIRDIKYHRGRFLLTCLGVGLLLTIVMSMSGIYRGLVEEALVIIRGVNADLWVVQRDTRGPFAEQSRLAEDVRYRVAIVPGVREVSPFVFYTIQRQRHGQPLRFAVVGYDLRTGLGGPNRIVAGRGLAQKRYEMVADDKLGLALGETLRLGLHDYTVVGLTRGAVGSGGDPVAFFSLADAQEIQFVKDNWAVRNARERAEAAYERALPTQPTLPRELARQFADNPDLHQVNALLVRLDPLADPRAVATAVERWGHFTAFTTGQQEELMLTGSVDKARRQIGLFRALLVIIATVIIAQIIYTMTLDKLKPIALLKLIGAPNRTIVALILQQSLSLGLIAYGIAVVLGNLTFDKWPRLVVVETADQLALLGVVVAICMLASALGIRRALRVEAGAALTG